MMTRATVWQEKKSKLGWYRPTPHISVLTVDFPLVISLDQGTGDQLMEEWTAGTEMTSVECEFYTQFAVSYSILSILFLRVKGSLEERTVLIFLIF
jgi:hypothetical protein